MFYESEDSDDDLANTKRRRLEALRSQSQSQSQSHSQSTSPRALPAAPLSQPDLDHNSPPDSQRTSTSSTRPQAVTAATSRALAAIDDDSDEDAQNTLESNGIMNYQSFGLGNNKVANASNSNPVVYLDVAPKTTAAQGQQQGGGKQDQKDICFKCEEWGHWAKNCPLKGAPSPAPPPDTLSTPAPTPSNPSAFGALPGGSTLPTPLCRCNPPMFCKHVQAGANNKKGNAGKWFYGCSKDRESQCSYFEWADPPSVTGSTPQQLNLGTADLAPPARHPAASALPFTSDFIFTTLSLLSSTEKWCKQLDSGSLLFVSLDCLSLMAPPLEQTSSDFMRLFQVPITKELVAAHMAIMGLDFESISAEQFGIYFSQSLKKGEVSVGEGAGGGRLVTVEYSDLEESAPFELLAKAGGGLNEATYQTLCTMTDFGRIAADSDAHKVRVRYNGFVEECDAKRRGASGGAGAGGQGGGRGGSRKPPMPGVKRGKGVGFA